MTTRTSHNWACLPGGFDTLNTSTVFPSSNPHEFPDLLPQDFNRLPAGNLLMPYRTKRPRPGADLCHFYLDDYRFEVVWSRPKKGLVHVQRYWAALTPDFSLYPQWPAVVQQWNTYRSRWLGRWWQEQGVRVVPTLNWSDEDSLEWCFLGIPRGQVVSLGVPDLRRVHVRRRFEAGVLEMRRQLDPAAVIVYGSLPLDLEVPVIQQAPEWERLRAVRKVA